MDLETSLSEIVAALLVPVFGYLAVLLRRWRINDTVLRAVARGAGTALLAMRAGRDEARAVEAGVDYVLSRVPDAARKAGVDGDALAEMVRAELGVLAGKKG
jgi:hypothetical protein